MVSSSATSGEDDPTSPAYPHWHDIIAGAASGLGARAVTAPLDLLKIRRQLAPDSTKAAPAGAAHAETALLGGEWKIFHHLHAIAEKEGGIRSLFRGNVAASYLWMGYSVTQFWLYGYSSEYLHRRYASITTEQHNLKISGVISFASGGIAGLCATCVTYPFDLCRTIFAARGVFPVAASNVTWSNYTTNLASKHRQQFVHRPPPKTLHEFARQMYRQQGIKGLYAGSAPGLLQIVPYMGINFALHDFFMLCCESSDSRLSGIAGMGAGVISKFVVYPLDTVKKRLQAQAYYSGEASSKMSTKYTVALPKGPSIYSNRRRVVGAVNRVLKAGNRGVVKRPNGGSIIYDGMIDCFKQIAKREGMAAFYKGLIPSLLKSSVSTGTSFWLFTLTKNMLQSIHDSHHFHF